MKIERYISVVVVLVVGLVLVNAPWPETTFAAVQAPTGSNAVQCSAPANAWCVPATAGSGAVGTFCTNAPAPTGSANPVLTSAEALGEAIGSVVAAPFVVAQCILVGCP
jgi:hypothetical protein